MKGTGTREAAQGQRGEKQKGTDWGKQRTEGRRRGRKNRNKTEQRKKLGRIGEGIVWDGLGLHNDRVRNVRGQKCGQDRVRTR